MYRNEVPESELISGFNDIEFDGMKKLPKELPWGR
jgi:hypothetical protein